MSRAGSLRTSAALLSLAIAGTAVLGSIACGDDHPPAVAVDAAARTRSAEAGIDWMLANWREMPPGWAFANLSRLARVTVGEPRAAKLSAALRADAATDNHAQLSELPLDAAILDPRSLTPMLLELLRRRENGLDWSAHAEAIGRLAAVDELGFWKSIPLRQRSTVVHLFNRLDIPTKMHLDAVTEALRQASADQGADALASRTAYVYAITHVVLARSDYFTRMADPTGLEFAIPVLRGALEYRLSLPVDVFALDQICEALASLQLLGVPDDELSERARTQVIALQNDDGSWGTGDGAPRRKIHPTFNAIVALLDLQAVLPAPDSGAGGGPVAR